MKTLQVPVYNFIELSEKAKLKAFPSLRIQCDDEKFDANDIFFFSDGRRAIIL